MLASTAANAPGALWKASASRFSSRSGVREWKRQLQGLPDRSRQPRSTWQSMQADLPCLECPHRLQPVHLVMAPTSALGPLQAARAHALVAHVCAAMMMPAPAEHGEHGLGRLEVSQPLVSRRRRLDPTEVPASCHGRHGACHPGGSDALRRCEHTSEAAEHQDPQGRIRQGTSRPGAGNDLLLTATPS